MPTQNHLSTRPKEGNPASAHKTVKELKLGPYITLFLISGKRNFAYPFAVTTGGNRLCPSLVSQIPLHGFINTGFKGFGRFPA